MLVLHIEEAEKIVLKKYLNVLLFNYCLVCMCCNYRWFRDVQNIFYLGNKRKLIPLNHLERFFNSASILMSNILRQLALDSIADYSNLFSSSHVNKNHLHVLHNYVYNYMYFFLAYPFSWVCDRGGFGG